MESITQVLERLPAGDAHIVTNRESLRSERWVRAGHTVEIWKLPYDFGKEMPIITDLSSRIRLAVSLLDTNLKAFRLMRRLRAGVAHCNDIISLMHAGPGVRLSGGKVVFNIRDVKSDGVYGFKWRVARNLASSIIVLSREMLEQLRDRMPPALSFKREHFHQIYSIVDRSRMSSVEPEQRAAIRAQLGLEPDCFHIGIVAVVCEKKNQLALVENLPQAWIDDPGWQMHCIGDFRPKTESYARRCSEVVATRGLEEHVRFLGFAERVEDWYRALDLLLVVSKREGLARCMIEGISCGTPVVSFDVTSAREVLEEHGCGLVFRSGDWEGLFNALQELREDSMRRDRLGQAGTRIAAKLFQADQVVAAYQQHYRELSGNIAESGQRDAKI